MKNILPARQVHDMGQSFGSPVYRHRDLPIYVTFEFDFFRCVSFRDTFYGKTISELHSGNLRDNKSGNRYSNLFQNERTSYWSESKKIARFEVRAHEVCKSYLMFWAYDDSSSTFPTADETSLHIVNGMDLGFSTLLYKSENAIELSSQEHEILDLIKEESPDCLVYESHVDPEYRNFLFFERGFKKLSLREVQLTINDGEHINRNRVFCASTCDYIPSTKSYGYYFEPIARKKFEKKYLDSDEFKFRNSGYIQSINRYREATGSFYDE